MLAASIRSQVTLPASPSTYTAYLGETTVLTLDGDSNVMNGASCLDTFMLSPSSPDQPTWASNVDLTLTFAPPGSLSIIGVYSLKYYVNETGTGSCTFIPSLRELSLYIAKRPPVINYEIPDEPNLRAAIPFEVVFPQAPCTDQLNDDLTYTLLMSDNTNTPAFINLDMDNNRIHGTVPNLNSGSFNLRLSCKDSTSQETYQDFMFNFIQNQSPTQHVTDLDPYKFTIGEGTNTTHTIPSGIFVDQNNDAIYYESAFFNDYTPLDDSWVGLQTGYEGTAHFNFTNVPLTSKTGFQIFLSDGIGSVSGFFLLEFEVNKRPTKMVPTLGSQLYPNDTLNWYLSLNTIFSDPESDPLTYTFTGLPAGLSSSFVSGEVYKISGDFPTSTADIDFSVTADDGVSSPVSVPLKIQINSCDTKCNTCFGGASTQCYSCTGSNVLDGNSCLDSCPAGKFDSNGVCVACHGNCATCTDAGNSNCQSCNSGFFLKGSTCDSDCGAGHFGYNNECYTCSENCFECTGELHSECTVCNDGTKWTTTACVPVTCLSTQYLVHSNCHDCNDACKTCTGGTNADCTE